MGIGVTVGSDRVQKAIRARFNPVLYGVGSTNVIPGKGWFFVRRWVRGSLSEFAEVLPCPEKWPPEEHVDEPVPPGAAAPGCGWGALRSRCSC